MGVHIEGQICPESHNYRGFGTRLGFIDTSLELSFNFRRVSLLMIGVTLPVLLVWPYSWISDFIAFRWSAEMFSWSWWSCGTPKIGCITDLITLDTVIVTIVSFVDCAFVIIFVSCGIDIACISFHLVITLFLIVKRHLGILAAGMPGIQLISLILFIFISSSTDRPSVMWLPLVVKGMYIVLSHGPGDSTIW